MTPTQASALATFVDLGRADSFAVLAGSATTNTGPSVITGDVGVSPGTSISGYGPPAVVNGTQHSADTVAQDAQTDLITAYNDAAGQPSDGALPPDAGGLTLVPGVYTASSTLGLTGTLTLDAQGNPNAVWVFQIGSGLTTASSSRVSLINGASPCNVFWKIGSSATLGTSTAFVGNILAMTSITATTSATIEGRALARNGAVTLDTNTITRPQCATGTTGGTTTAGTTGATTAGTTGSTTAGTTGATTAGTTGSTTAGTTGATTAGTTGSTTAGTTGSTTAGTTGSTTAGTTGATTAGTTGSTTAGTTGATTAGTTGSTTAGTTGSTTAGTTGGTTGSTTAGTTGGTTGGTTAGTTGGTTGGNGHGCKPEHNGYGDEYGNGYGDKPGNGYGDKPGQDDSYGCDPA
ncbi:ice-binding family protein [Streptomyces sp. NPDC006739]|uniref:ice-binding family protein n=1 Tax=Streptomyces sp. NPDC006739 TaxID=3364763 RepID=UPI003678D5FD